MSNEATVDMLFPLPLYTINIGRDFTKEELEFIKHHKSMRYPNVGNSTSLDHDILLHREMKDIKAFVDEHLDKWVTKILTPRQPIKLSVTQSWLNWSEPGESHHIHTHPNSYLSGVFYFSAEEGKDRINFHKPGTEFFQITPTQYNPFNSVIYWNNVKSGDLILFPSHISHNVDPTESSDTRISLAFNTFFKGIIGIEENLTRLWL